MLIDPKDTSDVDGNKTGEGGQVDAEPKVADGGGNPGKPDNKAGDESKITLTEAELQARIDRVVGERLDRQKRQYESDLQKQKDDAVAAEATKQGDFKTLYEKAVADIGKLSPKAEQADLYATQFNTSIESEIKDWPEEVKAMDPGGDDVSARLSWLEKGRTLAKKLAAAGAAPNPQMGTGSAVSGPAKDAATRYSDSQYKRPDAK